MRKEMVMKQMTALPAVMVLLVVFYGCSPAPKCASLGTKQRHDANLDDSVKAPVNREVALGNSVGPMEDQGFSVVDFQAKRDVHGMVFVIGEVRNVGRATKGVELQVTLRDTEGRKVAMARFCPAANHSLAPNETRPFAYSLGRYDDGTHAEVRIVRTFYTMDTLGLAALM